MKNPFKTAIKKVKNAIGGSSYQCYRHSNGDSQGRRRGGSARFSWEDMPSDEQSQEEQHHGAHEQAAPSEGQYHGAIVVAPLRAMDNESGLMFNQQEFQKYLSI